jgi:hypothetical protein
MYRAETSVYERLRTGQEKQLMTVAPRFIAAVALDMAPSGLHLDGNVSCRELFSVKGILLEYISDGFSLSELGVMAPPESWQAVVDRAVDIARALGDYGVLNRDVRPDNFIVTRPSGSQDVSEAEKASKEEFGVFMVDSGQSRVRGEDESDFEWGRDKWQQDEEGAVGQVMRHRLRKLGREISYIPSERYIEFAEGEDDE